MKYIKAIQTVRQAIVELGTLSCDNYKDTINVLIAPHTYVESVGYDEGSYYYTYTIGESEFINLSASTSTELLAEFLSFAIDMLE